jgi:spore coat protein U-like protein
VLALRIDTGSPGCGRHRGRRPRAAHCGGCAALLVLALTAADAAGAADCVVSTSGVAFGIYDAALDTPNDSTGALTVTCTYVLGSAIKVPYEVALSAGNSGNYAQRLLRAGTATLKYNLFDSATRTRVWGNGTAGTGLVGGTLLVGPGTGNNTRQNSHPVYGRIPALQDAATGTYSDSILVTLTF